MTITLYLSQENLNESLKTLDTIFKAGEPKHVEALSNFIQPLNITRHHQSSYLAINVSLEEYALIGVFNKGKL